VPTSRNQLGLTAAEARQRLGAEGPNTLPSSHPQTWIQLLWEVVSEPMLLMLVGAGALYLLLGEPAEAGLMLAFVWLIIAISFLQTRRTRRALEKLRDLSAPRARVLREGVALRIPGAEVVRGDILLLAEGDRIAADGRLLEGLLQVDASLLTGESGLVLKRPGGSNEEGSVHAGTLVAKGTARAEVTETGPHTRVGAIGRTLAGARTPPSPLQLAARRLVRGWATVGLLLAGLAVILAWRWAGRDPLSSILSGLALAMAMLPEEIPVVLSVFMAMGAWRMSARGVLTRRIPALEALGSITLLAVDKTGTLTQNRMAVAELWTPGASLQVSEDTPLPEWAHPLVEFSVLATPPDPFDPMEVALRKYAEQSLAGTEHLHGGWLPERTYALTADLLAMTLVYEAGPVRTLAAKGAPEAVLDLCHLPLAEREALMGVVGDLGGRGLRVLAVARGTYPGPDLPEDQHAFSFVLLGFVALEDPVRPEVPEAIRECRAAGIRVLMMTGDHPETARAIALKAGLEPGELLTGDEVAGLDGDTLKARLPRTTICARLQPEQKLRLVTALQASGAVVAMTGDGVNDAPALKAAQVGVAMGARGTDVARETADLVLVDDSFASLVEGVRMGRRVHDNLIRSSRFIYAVHVPVLLLTLIPLLLRWPPLLLPPLIVLMELLIDPACSLVLEAEPAAPDLMTRPPLPPGESPFGGEALLQGLLQGSWAAIPLLALAGIGHALGWGEAAVRGAVFPALVVTSHTLVRTVRSPRTPETGLTWAMSLGVVLGVGLLHLPAVRGLLHLGETQGPGWVGAALAASGHFAGTRWLRLRGRPPVRTP
jgi:Ca2+-transporting ATPase